MTMLSYDQKLLMAQMIFNERDILFGDFGPDLTKVEKQEKWIEILMKLNSVGANMTDYKVRNDETHLQISLKSFYFIPRCYVTMNGPI